MKAALAVTTPVRVCYRIGAAVLSDQLAIGTTPLHDTAALLTPQCCPSRANPCDVCVAPWRGRPPGAFPSARPSKRHARPWIRRVFVRRGSRIAVAQFVMPHPGETKPARGTI